MLQIFSQLFFLGLCKTLGTKIAVPFLHMEKTTNQSIKPEKKEEVAYLMGRCRKSVFCQTNFGAIQSSRIINMNVFIFALAMTMEKEHL